MDSILKLSSEFQNPLPVFVTNQLETRVYHPESNVICFYIITVQ